MIKKCMITAMLFLATAGSASAQKFSADPSFLKGQKQIHVIFDFSKAKYDGISQQTYYKSKGEEWVATWEGNRQEVCEEFLLKSLNEELAARGIEAGEYPEAAYTLVVSVLDCDFGSYAGPFSAPGKLECAFKIVKTGSTKVLSTVTLKKTQNKNTTIATPIDFDRMSLAFGELGEKLGKVLQGALK